MSGNYEFFEHFERNKYLKKLPSMQRVKSIDVKGWMGAGEGWLSLETSLNTV